MFDLTTYYPRDMSAVETIQVLIELPYYPDHMSITVTKGLLVHTRVYYRGDDKSLPTA